MEIVPSALLGSIVGVSIAGIYVMSKALNRIEEKLSEIIKLLKK